MTPKPVADPPKPVTDAPKMLLRVGEAAQLLSISIWKLRQLAYDREIVSVKVGALLMFAPEDLKIFVERNRQL